MTTSRDGILFRRIICAIILTCLAGCTERDRANPLDPRNPTTSGRLTGLTGWSVGQKVYLDWDPVQVDDLQSFVIYRTLNPGRHFFAYDTIPPIRSEYVDSLVTLGQDYLYAVSALAPEYESPRSDSVSVMPGPTHTWLLDGNSERVYRLTHDLRHTLDEWDAGVYPLDFAVDNARKRIWITNLFSRSVRIYDFSGRLVSTFGGWEQWNGRPTDIATTADGTRAWVYDDLGGTLSLVDSLGTRLGVAGDLMGGRDIAVNAFTNECWVAIPGRRAITVVFNNAQSRREITDMVAPQAIAFSARHNSFWMADSSRVVKLDEYGQVLAESERSFTNAVEVAVDPINGHCWVIDRTPSGNALIYRLNEQLNDETVELSRGARALAVNPFDHGCVAAESDRGRLLRLGFAGFEMYSVDRFNYPLKIETRFDFD